MFIINMDLKKLFMYLTLLYTFCVQIINLNHVHFQISVDKQLSTMLCLSWNMFWWFMECGLWNRPCVGIARSIFQPYQLFSSSDCCIRWGMFFSENSLFKPFYLVFPRTSWSSDYPQEQSKFLVRTKSLCNTITRLNISTTNCNPVVRIRSTW